MKNELNTAALHFIKFVKRSRNLAVKDTAFNATLENTKVCTSKDGIGRVIITHTRTQKRSASASFCAINMTSPCLVFCRGLGMRS